MTKFISMNTRNKLREISDTRINYTEIRIHPSKLIRNSIHALLRKKKRKNSPEYEALV